MVWLSIQGCKCGGVGVVHPSDICFSRSPNECSRSQDINCLNIDATFTVQRQNIFDLNARDNLLKNFGCINLRRESVY